MKFKNILLNSWGHIRFFWWLVLAILAVLLLAAATEYTYSYPVNLAKYNQMVVVLGNIDDEAGREIKGKAVRYNEVIIGYQRANRIPIIRLTIPNGYDNMNLFNLEDE